MIRMFTLSAVVLAVFLAGPAVAATEAAAPASQRWPVQPLAAVEVQRTEGLDRSALDREDKDRLAQGLPYRFASVQEVSLNPSDAGTWETLPSGRQLWRMRVSGRDVLSLNLGFTRFWLPAGSRLLVYAADGEGPVLAYDETDNAPHGELWTPVFLTDELVVELEIDPALRWQLELDLTSVGRGYRFFGEDLEAKAGACNIDVICEQGDDWREEIASVAVYSLGGATICTGWMTNNTAQDGTPYFMTAYHCNVRANWAPSVVVYWNFESPECGMQGGGSYEDSQSGAVLRAEWATSDMTLLELDEVPDPAFGVRYAGWDRSDAVPTSAVAIHHPSTDEKSISFEADPLSVTSYKSNVSPGDGTHLRVGDWDEGTTEPGSSGSPLFNQDHYVVGQLHGGAAACDNDDPDWYGWFHVSWEGGGTNGSRLSNWLDPDGTGEVTVETINPFGASFAVSPGTGLESSGIACGPFEPEQTVYTLTNTGSLVAQFTAQVTAGWMSVSPESGSIPAGQTLDVTLSVAESAASLAVGTHRTSLEITNTTQGAGTTSRPVTLTVIANEPRITAVAPNPFGGPAAPEAEIRYTLGGPASVTARIHDIRGRLVRTFGNLSGVAGENAIIWNGRGDGNVGLPSGKYIFILEAAGREEKTGIMLIH